MKRTDCKILKNRIVLYLTIFAVTVLLFSCRSTKHVPDDRFLLSKVSFDCDNSEIDIEELETTLKQKPNRKALGIRFYLIIYNSVNPEKEAAREKKRKIKETEINKRRAAKGKSPKEKIYFTRWLTGIGEAPVIYDEYAKDKTVSTIKSYLHAQSYYEAEITVLENTKKKKKSLTYQIKTGKPFIITHINYDIGDPFVNELVMLDTTNSLIRTNSKFNTDNLQTERERLVRMLKSNGYYYFSINNIHYYADTTINRYETELTLTIKKSFSEDNVPETQNFISQIVRNVYVYADYNAQLAIANPTEYYGSMDTLEVDGLKIIYRNALKIKPSIFLQSCFIKPGDRYNIVNVEKTHSHLSNLKQFKLINIKFNASEDVFLDTQKEKFLDAHIYLTPLIKQSYSLELEGNNTSGNLGMAGVVSYHNKNLIKGAQIFSVKGSLSFQTIKAAEEEEELRTKFFNTLEYGGELKLNIPKLMIPFYENYDFVKNHNPKTQISTSFSYQQRPDYTRSIANASFGYFWKGAKNKNITHYFNPIELYSVKIFDFNPEFQQQIQNLYIKYSYEDQLLSVISYDLMFNNQSLTKSKSFSYLWFNIETSGNIPNAVYSLAGIEPVDGSYKFMGVEFAQFVKTDIDYRYYQVFDENRSLVYRGFFGIGVPYGNSTKGLPFIKKYFIGGANDIRAWKVRSIGPGSYNNPNISYDQIADMKVMFNLEYRFKLVSFVNGAVFLDAGNIWAIDKNDNRAGALFDWYRFYREIAIGTGFGTRIDLSFFIIRFDFGIPLYDPSSPLGQRWLGTFETFEFSDFTFNFGIGYPF
ncbi:MAG: BamA/TamA family outer membrane protein [Bacteroidales bacterium]|nr:BamA/TamA family outer membrane protein [Bacteroidales bacterium]